MITPRYILVALLLCSMTSRALAVHGKAEPLPAANPAAARAAVDDPGALSWVRVDMANLRANATTHSKIVCQVAQNTAVLEQSRRGDWVSVAVMPNGPKGWVYRPLLAASEQAHERPVSRAAPRAGRSNIAATSRRASGQSPGRVGSRWVAISDDVTLRVIPKADAVIVATIPLGEELSVVDVRDDWLLVTLTESGATGWVPAQALESTDVVAVGAALFLKRTQLDPSAKPNAPLPAPRPASQ